MTPDYELVVNGSSITRLVKETNRLIELEIIDKRNLEADQLTLVLSDHDLTLALPPTGGIIEASIGFSEDGFADTNIAGAALAHIGLGKGDLITAGLAPNPLIEYGLWDKGKYVIDSIDYSGPPNIITIQASSADFRASLKAPHEQSYDEITFGDIARTIAARNALTPAISPALADKFIMHVDQTNESDSNFIARLAKQYGGVALFKNEHLTVIEFNQATTALGQALPDILVDITEVDRFNYSDEDRNARYTGAQAFWIDRATGVKMPELVGSKGYVHTIRHITATQSEAQQFAQAKFKELKTRQKMMDLGLSLGRPNALPSSPVVLSRFNESLSSTRWLSNQITHKISDNGYTSSIRCEPID